MRHGNTAVAKMAADIEIRRLTNFETATDGSVVRLVVEDRAGRPLGIILTVETLTALLMTMPTMASSVLRQVQGDPATRITHPVTEFRLERSPGDIRILTLGTPQGFSVSFSLSDELSLELGHAHLEIVPLRERTH